MESVLFLQQTADFWEQTYASIEQSTFKSYSRIRSDIPSSLMNKGPCVLEFPLKAGFLDAKAAKLGLSALTKLSKNKDLPPVLFFFNVSVFDADTGDSTYRFACLTEEDRAQWLRILKAIGLPDSLKQEQAIARRGGKSAPAANTPAAAAAAAARNGGAASGGQDDDDVSTSRSTTTGGPAAASTPQTKAAGAGGAGGKVELAGNVGRGNTGFNSPVGVVSPPPNRPPPRLGSNIKLGAAPKDAPPVQTDSGSGLFDDATMELMGNTGDIKDEFEHGQALRLKIGPVSVKFTNLFRFVEVILGFPGLILLDTFGPANRSSMLYYKPVIYLINLLITYACPLLICIFIMEKNTKAWVNQLTVAAMLAALYVLPTLYHIGNKLYREVRGSDVVDGMFAYKPSHLVRWNSVSNVLQIVGFLIDWVLMVVMVLPNNLFKGITYAKVSSYWPYGAYKTYFWIAIGLVYTTALILLLTAVLRGKTLYRFVKSSIPWHITFLVGNVLFLPISIILFMSLWCDFSSAPAVFSQEPSWECWGSQHVIFARIGFVTMGFLLLQYLYLPPGSFKETISSSLDIIFTPLYLTSHTLMKFIYAGIYVFAYETSLVRVPALTGISIIMFLFNNRMGPCSVSSVNHIRDSFFMHACMAGAMSTAYLVYETIWHSNDTIDTTEDRKWLYIYILGSCIAVSIVFTVMGYFFNKIQTENTLASNLVEIENNGSGIGCSSRALEPLIALSLSLKEDDADTGRKYIDKLVRTISHKSKRVQFQGIWAIASLSLNDEAARVAIHEGGGSKLLLNNFDGFSPLVQLEALAALSNMTLSDTVAESMVRQYNCIPFFMNLINGFKSKHSLFALICVGNLTRRETFREQIRCAGGIQTMVGCLMSHDYQKRKFGALALSNMALSVSEEMDQIFRTRGLIDRIVKMAQRKEVETQKEVVALVRNLACHSRLRPVLLNSGIMTALTAFRHSVHPGVAKWTDEIYNLMQREIAMGSIDDFKGAEAKSGGGGSRNSKQQRDLSQAESLSEDDKEYMKKMAPLNAKVEWETWGSKLETLFAPLVESSPKIQEKLDCETSNGDAILINLSLCLQTETFVQFKNDTKYIISELPHKGTLSHLATKEIFATHSVVSDTHSVVYTPKTGARNYDSFSFIVQLGSITTRPCTLNIKLQDNAVMQKGKHGSVILSLLSCGLCGKGGGDVESDDDLEAGKGKGGKGKGGFCGLCAKKAQKGDDYDTTEYASVAPPAAAAAAAGSASRGKGNVSSSSSNDDDSD